MCGGVKCYFVLSSAILFLLVSTPLSCVESNEKRVTFSIAEGQPAGTRVGTIGPQSGLRYRLNEHHHAFDIDVNTGEISTTIELDRDRAQSASYDLVVLTTPLTHPVEVHVEVMDINDNSPSFPTDSLAVSFLESAPPGAKTLLDPARDADAGPNSVTERYRILSGNEDEHFKLEVITNPSGVAPFLYLTVVGALDRESQSLYQLNISAEDGGSPQRYGFQLITVSIEDVNDNPPIFDYSDYTVSLNESVPVGTYVLNISATDSDIGDNAVISYYIDDGQEQFEVDPRTGRVLTLQDSLSCYQPVCTQLRNCNNSCVFTVRARDHGSPSLEGRAYITVNLVDDNDHAPNIRFNYRRETSHFATVNENAKINEFVAAVSVTDADRGANGLTSVQITGGNELGHFRLDSSEYNLIVVNSVLDREKISMYNLTIVASDMGSPPRGTTASLVIHVNDINDHAPAFEQSEYAAVLSEAIAVGSFVQSITATDDDFGINSNIYYAISGGNEFDWFEIDSETGLVVTRSVIDREVTDIVFLEIKASDGGPSPKEARTKLKITLTDDNDNAPIFKNDIVNISLSENEPPDTLVEQVIARDNDQGTNRTITYFFHPSVEQQYPNMFNINPSSGRVITKTKLDREFISDFKIMVVAKDHGIHPLSSTSTINLNILDVNDNSPVIYPTEYFLVIPSSSEAGYVMTQISTRDNDENQNAIVNVAIAQDKRSACHVDKKKSLVILRRKLDRDEKQSFSCSISAVDNGGRRAPENANVNIYINSGQYKYILFERKKYYFTIKEDGSFSAVNYGRFVGIVSIADKTQKVLYSIVDGDLNGAFNINEKSGQISTAIRIDREKYSMFKLNVVAHNDEAFGSIEVEIKVEDVNDNAPQFDTMSLVAHIEENAPAGHPVLLVKATDSDSGENGHITFSLTTKSDGSFHIDPETGMIFLSESLSTNVNSYQVEVMASDNGSPPLKNLRNISINVIDVNDHTPLFARKLYEVSLLESRSVNEKFFLLKAFDADKGRNGLVTYNITMGNERGSFGVFPDGYLFIKSSLDREVEDYYALTVVVRDFGDPYRSSSVSVIIYIIDENDHKPQFEKERFDFYFPENMPVNSFVGRLQATDDDIGRNADLTFSLSTEEIRFTVDPKTGSIRSLVSIDRESFMAESDRDYLYLAAKVMDNGVERLSDTVDVYIYITDVNDNRPVFTRFPHTAQISETAANGTLITRVSATDKDQGLNGDVIYSIIGGNDENMFRMNLTTGQIFLAGMLDREAVDTYRLSVSVSDAAADQRLTTQGVITVHVLDENDNEPEFIQTAALVSVPEDAVIGSELMQFQATDSDLGVNREVSYGIASGAAHGTFRIDTASGMVFLDKSLDYEQQSSYNLSVIASDGGSPSLTSSIVFTIVVTDINDNSPMFPPTSIVKEIPEDTPKNSEILRVTAHDVDAGRNGHIIYSFARDHSLNPFSIEPNTGRVLLKKELDREEVVSHQLTVVATDSAQPALLQRSSEKLITVIVTDVNDNAPVLSSVDTVLLERTTEAGSVIARVMAEDLDAGANGRVTYRLADGDRSVFGVDPVSGELRLLRSLISRYRTDRLYQITITTTDEADQRHRRSSDFVITILIIDTPQSMPGPEFTQDRYQATVSENEPEGTLVLALTAQDPVASDNSEVRYFITGMVNEGGGSVPRLFEIDSRRGVISTIHTLDYDRGDSLFILNVTAALVKGKQLSVSTVKVSVRVTDVNDLPPRLVRPASHTVNVSELTAVGTDLTHFVGADDDTDSELVYSLLSESAQGTFRLEAGSGRLILEKPLDRESRQLHQLHVRIGDGRHHTDFQFTVQVTDANDNAPSFTMYPYSFDISESAARGARVGAVTARDPDSGPNGRVKYSVIAGWDSGVFSLEPGSGLITLSAQLDFEELEHYMLVVSAEDGGGPVGLSATTSVYINVLDANDNEPLFDPQSYSRRVPESAPLGWHVLTVSATDQDSAENGRLTYRIASTSFSSPTSTTALQTTSREVSYRDAAEDFAILENGTIVVSQPLDRERRAVYNLVVVAEDSPSSAHYRLSSSAQVTIIVEDVNDEAPRFVSPNVTYVRENVAIQHVVLPILAVDTDEGANGHVEYALEPEWNGVDERSTFSLEPLKGLLRVAGKLDREQRATYRLTVTARDAGRPNVLSSHSMLTVHVTDENDNAPVFAPRHYSGTAHENATIGTVVANVSASDVDQGLNARLRYMIVGDDGRGGARGGSFDGDFGVDQYTGSVFVARRLSYTHRRHYRLSVLAEDSAANAGQRRYDTATVDVHVLPVNAHAPHFSHAPFVLLTMENSPRLPLLLGTITATDADFQLVEDEQQALVDEDRLTQQLVYSIREGDRRIFQYDADSGKLWLLKRLDREQQDSYHLLVTATDNGSPRRSGTAQVHVLVQDANDHAPEFSQQGYVARVSESAPPSTPLLLVTATDRDTGVNALISYSLANTSAVPFTIDTVTGQLRTHGRLDRELSAIYLLTVTASDSALTSQLTTAVNVTVHVTDVNDSPPQMAADSFAVAVSASAVPGTFVFSVEAWDADIGENARLKYSIETENVSPLLSIDSDTGDIRIAANSAYALVPGENISAIVRVSDSGRPVPRATSARLHVLLRPEVEFPRLSKHSGTFTLDEGSAGRLLMSVKATPADNDEQPVRYAIVGGNVGAAFSVQPQTGELRVSAQGVDRELNEQYTLWLEATGVVQPGDSGASSRRSAYTSVIVLVNDINDNRPQFEQPSYRVGAMEGREPTQFLLQLVAHDSDSGANGSVTYRLGSETEPEARRQFTLDSRSGRLSVTGILDRELRDHYVLSVEAVDGGDPPLIGTSVVLVDVLDKNDNPPRFTRLFSANVTENAPRGAFVVQVTSTDADRGVNARAQYSFTRNVEGRFAIDSASGNITVVGKIDSEEQEEYSLAVLAVDGSWQAETSVTVAVHDLNDNTPRFERMQYNFSVAESEINHTLVSKAALLSRTRVEIGTVQAIDVDSSPINSDVTYRLERRSELLAIDSHTGQLFVTRPLVYTRQRHSAIFAADGLTNVDNNQFSVRVIATDGGRPALSSTCSVTVHVAEANRHAPVFSRSEYSGAVAVTASRNERVLRVIAVDSGDSGVNAQISYRILSGNGSRLFSMISDSDGWIVVGGGDDYIGHEGALVLGEVYILHVEAVDAGLPPKNARAVVRLQVTDENMHAPRFTAPVTTRSPSLLVSEGEPMGTVIYQLRAIDEDPAGPNSRLHYMIVSGANDGAFQVDPESGTVRVAKPLDRELRAAYRLTVEVRDSAFRPRSDTAQLSVSIDDVDDCAPRFNSTRYQVFVPEDITPGTWVTQLTAIDLDSARFAAVRYSIVGGSGRAVFAIDTDSGRVVTRRRLDYETSQLYRLDVVATNPGSASHMGQTQVFIHVTGVNEFYPHFDHGEYHFSVDESAAVGSVVGVVMAKDGDRGVDGEIHYLLMGANNRLGFRVERYTGVIRLGRTPDRHTQNRAVLKVMAKNAGSIRANNQTDLASVFITIRASSPAIGGQQLRFRQSVYRHTVLENALAGQSVARVQAESSTGSRLSYSISASDGNLSQPLPFSISADSGHVTTLQRLDRELHAIYRLTVVASTSTPAAEPQTATASLIVTIDDVNDHAPQLAEGDLLVTVGENQPAGTLVTTLTATDHDSPINGAPFTYHLVDSDDNSLAAANFAVESASGRVTTTRRLDREITPLYRLSILVTDSGRPPLSATYSVDVHVTDSNDNPSSPRHLNVRVVSPAGVFPGGPLADIRPADADSSAGRYRCALSDNASSLFSVTNGSSVDSDGSMDSGCLLVSGSVVGTPRFDLITTGRDGVHAEVTSSVHVQFGHYMASDVARATVIVRVQETHTTAGDTSGTGADSSVWATVFRQLANAIDTPKHTLQLISVSEPSVGVTDLVLIIEATPDAASVTPPTTKSRVNSVSSVLSRDETTRSLQAAGQKITGALDRNVRIQLDFDPCSEKPCGLGGTSCSSQLELAAGYSTVSSLELVVTSRRLRVHITCTCGKGFSGERCELSRQPCQPETCGVGGVCVVTGSGRPACMCKPGFSGATCRKITTSAAAVGTNSSHSSASACSPSPCANGGRCSLSVHGEFFCLCSEGFRGTRCQHAVNSCRSSPCQNGATCVSQPPPAFYRCQCRPFFHGRQCQSSSWGFTRLSYAAFPPLDALTNDVALTLATTSDTALLVYSYGALASGGRSDFLAVQLMEGRPQLVFGGALTPVTRLTASRKVSDGEWYRVTATRSGRAISLTVASCSDQHRCADCVDTASTENCNHVSGHATTSTLNLVSDTYIGGVETIEPLLQRPGQVAADDFVGCIHSVHVDGRPLQIADARRWRHILPDRCPRSLHTCGAVHKQCGAEGRCIDEWTRIRCQCPRDKSVSSRVVQLGGPSVLAPDCGPAFSAVSLHGGRLELLPEPLFSRRRQSALAGRTAVNGTFWPHELSVRVRTVDSSGVLLYAESGTGFTLLQIKDSVLEYRSRANTAGPTISMTADQRSIDDGSWHEVSLHVTDTTLQLLVDGTEVGEPLHAGTVHDFLDDRLKMVTVGGAAASDSRLQTAGALRGCVAAAIVAGELQPVLPDSGGGGDRGDLFRVRPVGAVSEGCLAALVATDPLSVGITLVIVFFVVLFVAIAASFVVFRLRRHRLESEKVAVGSSTPGGATIKTGDSMNAAGIGSLRPTHLNGNSNGAYLDHTTGLSVVSTQTPIMAGATNGVTRGSLKLAPRPDVIERDIVDPSLSHIDSVSQQGCLTDSVSQHAEHYDLENASSIAPSDIDVVYHYRRYRCKNAESSDPMPDRRYRHIPNGHDRKHRPLIPTPQHGLRHGGQQHGYSGGHPAAVGGSSRPTAALKLLQQQASSTPLARLSPSSELSHQTPRILTLQDISGKPLPPALSLNSEQRSLISPVSHLSRSSVGSLHGASQTGPDPAGPRQVPAPGPCRLVNTLDAVSSDGSERNHHHHHRRTPPPHHFHHPHHPHHHHQHSSSYSYQQQYEERERRGAVQLSAPTSPECSGRVRPPLPPLLRSRRRRRSTESHSSSDSESGRNDSFTCSEFEYEPPPISSGADTSGARQKTALAMALGKMAAADVLKAGNGTELATSSSPSPSSTTAPGPNRLPVAPFGGSLSTLVASDDELTTAMPAPIYQPTPAETERSAVAPPTGTEWNCLLNWGPSFQSLAGVFSDIGQLPDSVAPNSGAPRCAPVLSQIAHSQSQPPSEEYV